jgi:hypothetical protein
MCAPAEREQFFVLAGDPATAVLHRPPALGKDEQTDRWNERILFHGRVTPSRLCRICEAECPGIAAVYVQTGSVGMQGAPDINT